MTGSTTCPTQSSASPHGGSTPVNASPSMRTNGYRNSHILKGDQARPITRLIHGTNYAIGILAATPRITCHLDRPVAHIPEQLAEPQIAPAFVWALILPKLRDRGTRRG